MIRLLIRLTLVLSFPVAEAAFAQIRTGIPPFSSQASSSFDTVNEANLNVFFSIPVLKKAGVGLPFAYSIGYNNSIWAESSSNGTLGWSPAANWGWAGTSSATTGTMSYQLNQGSCYWPRNDYGHWYYWNIYNYTAYYDPQGTIHLFNQTVSSWSSTIPCGSGAPRTYTGTTTDGSGYTITVTANPDATVYAPSGVWYYIPVYSQIPGGSMHDTNSNEIVFSTTSNTTTFTDTLGATALTVSGSGTPSSPVVYTYTGGNGQASVQMNYSTYTVQTNFGCSGVPEFGASQRNLVSSITLPDTSTYSFTYEWTPGYYPNVTGRIASVTLPTGGTISYNYSGGSNGIYCNDLTTPTLTRTSSDGAWTYAHTEAGTNGVNWTTKVTDPALNDTVLNFAEYWTGDAYEEERKVYQGSQSSGNVLKTVDTCYNGAPLPCIFTAIAWPITSQTVQVTTPGLSPSQVSTTYNGYGLPTEVDEYDWGPTLVRKTVTAYNSNTSCGVTNAYVFDRPCTVTVEDASSNPVASASSTYFGSGNLQSVTSGGLTKSYTYNTNGTVATSTDVNNAQTTYSYGAQSCNGAFPTTIAPPAGPAQTLSWNCPGAVLASIGDTNGTTYYGHSDPFWRVTSITDPTNAVTNISYLSNSVESILNFGSSSTVDTLTNLDALGRPSIVQKRQAQGSSSFDSVETVYDSLGRPYRVSPPYSAGSGGAYGGSVWNTTLYDPLNRPTSYTDAGGGTVGYSYNANDVLITASPKSTQYQYDALGRLGSVCEVTNASGSGPCSQNTTATGFFTSYTYNLLDNLQSVAQSGQGRTYGYDSLMRLTSESNPESGVTNYVYDTDSTCGTSHGDMVKRTDSMGNVTCYQYDAGHRATSAYLTAGSPYFSATPIKHFVYDSATVNGVAMLNVAGHMAEAYTCTGTCTIKLTDIGFSYNARGDPTDVYESTPNSGGYYHASASYWANGLTKTLNLYNAWVTPQFPAVTYNPEGEGRVGSTTATGQNPLSSAAYSLFSSPTSLQFGSGDGDTFTPDPNTGRVAQYSFNLNGTLITSGLSWNTNGTLNQLAITDPINSSNQQTCNYGYDSLARLASVNCLLKPSNTQAWWQTFAPDALGNLTKTGLGGGATSFLASFTNNRVSTGGYDALGNLLSDPVHSYSYDANGHAVNVDGTGLTYDALDRMVEQNRSGSYTQIVYGPGGGKLALMNGQTLGKAFVPLPAGATAVYNAAGLAYYRHPDWLGSSRFASTPSRTLYSDGAYAPFGENYAETGTQDREFAGMNQDTVSTGAYPLYDGLFREYHPTWGRWLTPDPAGLAAADPSDPQTWNRYAYVTNNPLALTDPLGLGDCPANTHRIGPGQCEDNYAGGGLQLPWYLTYDPFSWVDVVCSGECRPWIGVFDANKYLDWLDEQHATLDISKTWQSTFPCSESARQLMSEFQSNMNQFAGNSGVPFAANFPSAINQGDTLAINIGLRLLPGNFVPQKGLEVTVASVTPNSFMFQTNPQQHFFNGTIVFMASDAGSGSVNFAITANANFSNPLYRFIGAGLKAAEGSTWNNLLNNLQNHCNGGTQ